MFGTKQVVGNERVVEARGLKHHAQTARPSTQSNLEDLCQNVFFLFFFLTSTTNIKDMDEEDLQQLYGWIDEIPLSRQKRNIARDFSDAGKERCTDASLSAIHIAHKRCVCILNHNVLSFGSLCVFVGEEVVENGERIASMRSG